jgi:hypothetical protein
VILGDAPPQRENHRHSVVRYFLQAVRRDVCDNNAQFFGRLEIDIVDADAIANDTLYLGQGLKHPPRYRRPLNQQRIGIATTLNDFILRLANGLTSWS